MKKENFKSLVDDIIKYSKIMYDRGLVSAAGGNISAISGKETFLITASGCSFRDIDQEDILLCDFLGNIIDGDKNKKPSKEYRMHAKCYIERPKTLCVAHLHPSCCIAFTAYDKELPLYTSSSKLKLKKVPNIEEALPGSEELADNVAKSIRENKESEAFLIKAHGTIVLESSLKECLDTSELLEDTAKIALLAKDKLILF